MQRVLYGFGGAEDQFRCLKTYVFFNEVAIADIRREVSFMRTGNPSIRGIYIVDNRRGLRRELTEALKKNSIESCYIFLDTIKREGICVWRDDK